MGGLAAMVREEGLRLEEITDPLERRVVTAWVVPSVTLAIFQSPIPHFFITRWPVEVVVMAVPGSLTAARVAMAGELMGEPSTIPALAMWKRWRTAHLQTA